MSVRRLVLTAVLCGGALGALAPAAGGAGGPTVFIVDNAFVRGVDRPSVRLHAGVTVTWVWRARQSHGLNVRSGPERFSAPIRHGGRFRHRFDRRGTYRIVCALHAPGMKMSVVVR